VRDAGPEEADRADDDEASIPQGARWRSRGTFALLYFAEGAPIGFIWWTLPTLLRADGVAVEAIAGLTSLVVLPWSLKVVWAPLVDVLARGRVRLRLVIGLAQLAMAATLLPVAFVDAARELELLTVLLVAHAFFAATQDVAVDALCIATVPVEERGSINGFMQAGMLFGRSLFGGAALVVASSVGRTPMVLAMVGVLVGVAVAVLAFGPVAPGRGHSGIGELVAAARVALRRRHVRVGLLFALTAAAGYQGVTSVLGPFLVDHGIGQEAIGVFFGVGSVSAMVTGALAGGMLADRFGRRRVILGGQGVVVLGIGLAVATTTDGTVAPITWSGLVAMYAGIGLFTAAMFARFMDHTDPRLGATQFSAYMASTNLSEAWSTRLTGTLVTRSGYPTAFLTVTALGVLALPLLAWLGRARPAAGEATRNP